MKQVAQACGFGSVSYMTTFLKKHLRMTPGQLRGGRSRCLVMRSLACAAGLDRERAWMDAGSHASPKRKRGKPYCVPNKTAGILKSTDETCNCRAQQDWDAALSRPNAFKYLG